MDRLAAHIIATAALTAALAAVPAALGTSTSDAKSIATPAATASPTATASSSASASAQPSAEPKSSPVQPIPCPDAYQVGVTAYAHWHGIIAFSVKEFYSPSCHAVYGYAYPWLQFRRLNARYDLGLAVFDVTHDAIDGARTFVGGAGGPDFWSSPVTATAKTCTQGLAHVFFPDTETDTYTTKFCQ
jgi:hypothetical protein